MTEISIKAKVKCTDGSCGKSTRLIADPDSGKLTHFVVKYKKLPDSDDRLVPVEMVANTDGGTIQLNCTRDELAALPPFTTFHYVQKEIPDYPDTYIAGGSMSNPLPPLPGDSWVDKAKDEHIPGNELALAKGMTVKAKEGEKVGQVDGLIVDPDSAKVSHLLMLEGHLWAKKDVALPVSAIEFIDADTVYLKIDKTAAKDLPTASGK